MDFSLFPKRGGPGIDTQSCKNIPAQDHGFADLGWDKGKLCAPIPLNPSPKQTPAIKDSSVFSDDGKNTLFYSRDRPRKSIFFGETY